MKKTEQVTNAYNAPAIYINILYIQTFIC